MSRFIRITVSMRSRRVGSHFTVSRAKKPRILEGLSTPESISPVPDKSPRKKVTKWSIK